MKFLKYVGENTNCIKMMLVAFICLFVGHTAEAGEILGAGAVDELMCLSDSHSTVIPQIQNTNVRYHSGSDFAIDLEEIVNEAPSEHRRIVVLETKFQQHGNELVDVSFTPIFPWQSGRIRRMEIQMGHVKDNAKAIVAKDRMVDAPNNGHYHTWVRVVIDLNNFTQESIELYSLSENLHKAKLICEPNYIVGI